MYFELQAFRDFKISACLSAAIELLLIFRSFIMRSSLVESHFWLDLLQMPGAPIAEHIFRFVGRPQAFLCLFLIQWIIFTLLILGAIYLYRLLRTLRVESQ